MDIYRHHHQGWLLLPASYGRRTAFCLRSQDCLLLPPASCLLPPAVGGRRQEAVLPPTAGGRRSQSSSSCLLCYARSMAGRKEGSALNNK